MPGQPPEAIGSCRTGRSRSCGGNSPDSLGGAAASCGRGPGRRGMSGGGAYVPVNGRGVLEDGEHAGGEVGAGADHVCLHLITEEGVDRCPGTARWPRR